MTSGDIRYAITDGLCVIRMEGRLTYALGVGFGLFLDGLFDDGAVRDVVVDLGQAAYLDSTMLGLLGKLANGAQHHLNRQVTLAAPCENIRELLSSIGFDDIFAIQDDRVSAADLRRIPSKERPGSAQARVILDAHRTLMEMNDSNTARFRNVVELLDRKINASEELPLVPADRLSPDERVELAPSHGNGNGAPP